MKVLEILTLPLMDSIQYTLYIIGLGEYIMKTIKNINIDNETKKIYFKLFFYKLLNSLIRDRPNELTSLL